MSVGEDPAYLTDGLITCIGNKRSLLKPIEASVEIVKKRLGKRKLRVLDAFAGSGVVSRLLKGHASYLASNDLEDYASVVAKCHLANRSEVDHAGVADVLHTLNRVVQTRTMAPGFIEELYAPEDDEAIRPGERAFYTRDNARRLDDYRRLIELLSGSVRTALLASLLSKASVHANTAGVFKGFYKDRNTGVGCFGGSNGDALKRIKGEIRLEAPVFSRYECDVEVFREDANAVVRQVRDLDLAYLDPPYNQHPYGSNYFMLNLLTRYERPSEVSPVSGIPVNWRRSGYNVRARSLSLMQDLIESVDARFVLVSFSDEGFIEPGEMRRTLDRVGRVEVVEIPYNAYRGSRHLNGRAIHLKEHLFLLEKN